MARKPAAPTTDPAELAAGAPPDAPDAELPALYVAKFRVCNPFQNFYLHDIPKEITMDSWWECQIEAGVVIKVQ